MLSSASGEIQYASKTHGMLEICSVHMKQMQGFGSEEIGLDTNYYILAVFITKNKVLEFFFSCSDAQCKEIRDICYNRKTWAWTYTNTSPIFQKYSMNSHDMDSKTTFKHLV